MNQFDMNEFINDNAKQFQYKKLRTLRRNLTKIKEECIKDERDWVIIFSGPEGDGKTTMSMITSFILNPDFDVPSQFTNNLLEAIRASKKFRKIPFKVITYDEGGEVFFSRESMYKWKIRLIKFFTINRSFCHFYLINIPNFFWLDKYMREARVKSLIYVYKNYMDGKRYFAFYNRKNYHNILASTKESRHLLLIPEKFVKKYQPNFIGEFPQIPKDSDLWQNYVLRVKEPFQDKVLEDLLQELQEEREMPLIDMGMDSETFLKWLCSYFRAGRSIFLKFTQEQVALFARKDKGMINGLVKKLRAGGYLQNIGQRTYELTEKGLITVDGIGREVKIPKNYDDFVKT